MMKLSPLNQRRWKNFRANERAFWSLIIFGVLFAISLCAEFIANDKPILVKYRGEYFTPIFNFYPETRFGGDFKTEAVYRDPEVQCLIKSGGVIDCFDIPYDIMDEIQKQYVMTAKAKGLSESRVLYGHIFRNAMLIVIAGFPAVFVGVFFGASLIIETIFSLDGLGRLGFEAAVARDYPVIFGTLFIFGLMGLVIGILSDLMYVFVDPRIDFEGREG